MRYRVSVSIAVNEYMPGMDQIQNYTQTMYHSEQTDVTADTFAEAGAQFDGIVAGIRKVLHGDDG